MHNYQRNPKSTQSNELYAVHYSTCIYMYKLNTSIACRLPLTPNPYKYRKLAPGIGSYFLGLWWTAIALHALHCMAWWRDKGPWQNWRPGYWLLPPEEPGFGLTSTPHTAWVSYLLDGRTQLFHPTATALPMFTWSLQWKMVPCQSKALSFRKNLKIKKKNCKLI